MAGAEEVPWAPTVGVAADGTCKYVLLKLEVAGGPSKVLVRGLLEAEFHDDVCVATRRELAAAAGAAGVTAQWDLSCLGGGRIRHDARAGELFVYGYSVAYGRADHAVAVAALRAAFPPSYRISWSNDGY
jgi:phosphohistidine phosphatase